MVGMPAFCIGLPLSVLAVLLPVQLPTNVPRRQQLMTPLSPLRWSSANLISAWLSPGSWWAFGSELIDKMSLSPFLCQSLSSVFQTNK